MSADRTEKPANFLVFVPTADSAVRATIPPGSAIVGVWASTEGIPIAEDDEHLEVDYQGNVHGAADLARFAQRCMHAAGRSRAEYPTGSRLFLTRRMVERDLVEIGVYDSADRLVYLDGPKERELLAEWLGVSAIEDDELHAR